MKKINLEEEIKNKVESLGLNRILVNLLVEKFKIDEEDSKKIIDRSFNNSIETYNKKLSNSFDKKISKNLSEVSTEDLLKDENITKG